jgi:Uma2 family endonuclease
MEDPRFPPKCRSASPPQANAPTASPGASRRVGKSTSNGGFELPDGSIRAPDAAWISSEGLPPLTEDERETFAPLCPDFVVELRFKSDRIAELREKRTSYLANGARVG